MTETEDVISGSGLLESKFWRVFFILISAVLIFAGPTYVPYILADALKLNYIVSISIGFGLFAVGVIVLVYLIQKKVIN
jgi:hypothetical protein